MSISVKLPRHRAYLLRCWEERSQSVSVWRFSLEEVHTNQRRGFASLEGLRAYLEKEMADEAAGPPAPHLPPETQERRDLNGAQQRK